MNANDVREALRAHWKADRYLVLEECGQDSMRQGRKIDMLVVSIWKSRGHYLDAVEIKVSLADWKVELSDPHKADWWWEHTNRFWLAVPADLVSKVKDTVPESWGLLSVGEKVKVVIEAPTRRECTPLPWTAVVGAMRCASGAGANALMRARAEGRNEGYKEGKLHAERNAGDEFLREQARDAIDRLKTFCDAAGISPDDLRHGMAEGAGRLWALMRSYKADPIKRADRLMQAAKHLEEHAAQVRELSTALLATDDEELA